MHFHENYINYIFWIFCPPRTKITNSKKIGEALNELTSILSNKPMYFVQTSQMGPPKDEIVEEVSSKRFLNDFQERRKLLEVSKVDESRNQNLFFCWFYIYAVSFLQVRLF